MNKNKPLIDRFIDFNKLHRIGHRKKECLLAVSGGIDSVVLTDLFAAAGFPFAIAHCNFNLRGEESNADSRFVRNLANQYKVKAYVKVFDTTRYAEEHKISIQVAARRLRYEWFAEICTQKGYGLIITAHHLNDNIETILYNLAKGAGIRGLRGIPVRQGNIARPLLFASRSEIEAYQRDKNLEFREDSSNAEDKYARNKIRHHVIPVLQELNPSFEKTLAEKIGLLTEIEGLYNQRISRLSKQLFVERKGNVYIPLLKIKKTKNVSSVLFEYLKNYGFNSTQVEDMLAAIDEPPGKQFLSDKARIIKDRRFFILT
ncbi:MAG TPA: tRNA lysidine(34) synthetase TilS, partial [Chitinophagales bacterium]|nr:tRNA lysidine(34) synthetase TilS [Chitinophagales bacterium]